MFISLIFNIKWWTESKGCSIELSDFETPEITKCWLGDVKCFGSISALPVLFLPPLDPTSALPVNLPWSDSCSQQLGKNPFNSSFAWFKVAEFGLSSFLGRLGSMPCAEVLSRTWQGLSPPQHCLFGLTLGNKLRSYTSFALQQKEGKKFSDKFLNNNPAKIYNKKFICKPLQCTEFKSTPLHNDLCLNTRSQMQKKRTWLIVTRAKIWLNRAEPPLPSKVSHGQL